MSPPVQRQKYCFSRVARLNYKKRLRQTICGNLEALKWNLSSRKGFLICKKDFGVSKEILEL